jgi:AcrR family transcriptional regulator
MAAIDEELGLRERKRLATRRAIQLAALELATERGFDRVTIDEISHVANISPRTFFNYFPSKESAIIGEVPELPDAEIVENFINAGKDVSILQGLSELLIAAVDNNGDIDPGEAEGDDTPEGQTAHGLHQLRRDLLTRNPELFALRMASMHQFEDELCSVVQRRLEQDHPYTPAPEELHQRARLITYVAFAGMRHAWSCWADIGGVGLFSDRLRASFVELQSISEAERERV